MKKSSPLVIPTQKILTDKLPQANEVTNRSKNLSEVSSWYLLNPIPNDLRISKELHNK